MFVVSTESSGLFSFLPNPIKNIFFVVSTLS
jgi:hypothetical protein